MQQINSKTISKLWYSVEALHTKEQGPVLNPEECTGIFLKITEIALN